MNTVSFNFSDGYGEVALSLLIVLFLLLLLISLLLLFVLLLLLFALLLLLFSLYVMLTFNNFYKMHLTST